MTPEPIVVHGTLTPEDLLSGGRTRLGRVHLGLGVLAALCAGVAVTRPSTAMGVVAVVAVAMIGALEFAVRRQARRHPQVGPIAVTLSQEGVEVTLGRLAGRQAWTHFRSMKETDGFFFLSTATNTQVLPKRYFTRPGDLEEARRLFTANIGHGASLPPGQELPTPGQAEPSSAALLEARGTLTRRDTMRVSLHQTRPLLVLLAVIAVGELALFAVGRELAELWWALVAGGGLALILRRLAVKVRRLPPLQEVTVTMFDESLWIRTATIESNQLWGYFRSVKETRRDFVLRSGRRSLQGLPKRLFTEDQLAAARQIFAQKVPPS